MSLIFYFPLRKHACLMPLSFSSLSKFQVFPAENADCDGNRSIEVSLVEIHIATDQSQFFDGRLWPTDIPSQNFLTKFLIDHNLWTLFLIWPNIQSKKYFDRNACSRSVLHSSVTFLSTRSQNPSQIVTEFLSVTIFVASLKFHRVPFVLICSQQRLCVSNFVSLWGNVYDHLIVNGVFEGYN